MNPPPKVVLAIDTSTRTTRVAFGRLHEKGYRWSHSTPSSDRHGTALLPAIQEVSGGERAELIAVANGPGSFTGLRVGLSAVKALAFVWEVPVLPSSSLAAMGYLALDEHPDEEALTVFADAGRGEVYVGRYDVRELSTDEASASLELRRRLVLRGSVELKKVSEFVAEVEGQPSVLCVGPDLAEMKARSMFSDFRETPDPVGEDAALRHILGAKDMSDAVEPHYVRAVDAKLPSA